MKQLICKQYNSKSFKKDKFYYTKKETSEFDIYYIFKYVKLLSKSPLKLELDKSFSFCVPKEHNRKCFCYEGPKELDITNSIFELTEEEYLNTHLFFINNDKNVNDQISSKIIQDVT